MLVASCSILLIFMIIWSLLRRLDVHLYDLYVAAARSFKLLPDLQLKVALTSSLKAGIVDAYTIGLMQEFIILNRRATPVNAI